MFQETKYNNKLPIYTKKNQFSPIFLIFSATNNERNCVHCPPSMYDQINDTLCEYLVEPGSQYINKYDKNSPRLQITTNSTMNGKHEIWHSLLCIENTNSDEGIFDDSGTLDITTSTAFMPSQEKQILHKYKLAVGDMISWSSELPAFLNPVKNGHIVFLSAKVLIKNKPVFYASPYVEECKCVLCIHHNDFRLRDLNNALSSIGCKDIINIVIEYSNFKTERYRSECCCGFGPVDNHYDCSMCYEQFVEDSFMCMIDEYPRRD